MFLDYAVPYSLFGFQVNHDANVFPVFTNLKHLELKVEGESVRSEYLLCSFMKASPYLQRLVLKVTISYPVGIYIQFCAMFLV